MLLPPSFPPPPYLDNDGACSGNSSCSSPQCQEYHIHSHTDGTSIGSNTHKYSSPYFLNNRTRLAQGFNIHNKWNGDANNTSARRFGRQPFERVWTCVGVCSFVFVCVVVCVRSGWVFGCSGFWARACLAACSGLVWGLARGSCVWGIVLL